MLLIYLQDVEAPLANANRKRHCGRCVLKDAANTYPAQAKLVQAEFHNRPNPCGSKRPVNNCLTLSHEAMKALDP